MYGRIYDDERNPKLYLVESQVPRVASFLGLRKAREQPESAVCMNVHTFYKYYICGYINLRTFIYFLFIYVCCMILCV